MSWAARRRLFVLLIIGAVLAAFIALIGIATLYHAPSCTDSVMNQGEAGVDCGGPCAYLCTALEQPPTVLFTKAFTDPTTGRSSVVASIENKNNIAAAKNVPYRATIYGAGQTLIQSVTGSFDLPPGATAAIFIPGIFSGKQPVVSAFLEVDPSAIRWFTMTSDPRIVPGVSNATLNGSTNEPRIDATLLNSSVSTLTNVKVIVLVRDTLQNVIAASQTLVPTIPPHGQASASFTWNTAFPAEPASIEVMPVIPLP